MLEVTIRDESFTDWPALLDLIRRAFAYMAPRIDPPSSMRLLTDQSIAEKAEAETLLLARDGEKLVGCVFLRDMGEAMYMGKLAVDPAVQGSGAGRALVKRAVDYCREAGKRRIELESRIELTEVHDFFRRQGFRETGRTTHAGYTRPTAIVMTLDL